MREQGPEQGSRPPGGEGGTGAGERAASLSKLLGVAALLVFCLGAFAVALHVFLATGTGERLTLRVVNSLIPGTIALEDVSLSLFGGSVEIVNGRLEGPDGTEIVRVDRVKAVIELSALLRRRVVLSSVNADRPVVRLVRRTDGTLNIVEALVTEEESETEGFDVVLGHFRARGGAVSYDDEGVNLSARLEGVGLAGAFDFPASAGWASASVGNARADIDGFALDLKDSTLRARLAGQVLSPLFVAVNRGRYRVCASGSIRELFTRPDFDVVFEAGGELADLFSLFGPGQGFAGNTAATVRVKGVLSDPEVTCRVSQAGGMVAGVPVEGLSVDARMKGRVAVLEEAKAALRPGKVSLSGQADLRQAFPRGFFSPGADARALTYAFSGKAEGLSPMSFLPEGETLPGTLSGTISARGRGVSLSDLAGSASFDLKVAGLPPNLPLSGGEVGLKGTADLEYPALRFETAAFTGTGARANGTGRLDLERGTVGANVNLRVARLAEVLAGLGVPAEGTLDARARVSGRVKAPCIEVSARGRGIRWSGRPVGSVAAEGMLDETGKVTVSRFDVADGGSTLSARGSVKVFRPGFEPDPAMPVDLEAMLRADLAGFSGGSGAKGVVEGRLSLGGSLFDPAGAFSFTGKGLSFKGASLGEAALEGGISRGAVEVDRLDLVNRGSTVRASGRADLFDTRKMRLKADPAIQFAASGDLRDLSAFTPSVTGSASFEADIRGTLGDPRGTVQATGRGITVSGQEIQSCSLSANLANRRVTVGSFEAVVAQGQRVTGEGWLGIGKPGPYELRLKSEGISLLSLTAPGRYGVTGGTLQLDIAGRGTLENPRLTGDLLLTSLTVNREPHKDVFVHLRLADGRVGILGESTFGFDGTYDLESEGLDLHAIFKDTELEPYFRIAGRPELHGVITGDAVLSGSVRSMRDMDLDLSVAQVDILLREDRVLSGSDLTLGYHDRRLNIPSSRLKLLEKGSMDVRAVTDKRGNLDLAARGLLPLEILPLLLPDLENLIGTLRFDLNLRGPSGNPALTGDLYLEDAGSSLSYNDQVVHDVNGHLSLEGNRAIIRDLSGMVDTGTFTAGGEVVLEGIRPVAVDLNVRALSLPFALPDAMNLVLEADVTMRGTPDATLLSGKAVVVEGSYYKDVQLNLIAEVGQRITGGRVSASAPGRPVELPFLKGMELDLTVTRRGTVSIDNNLADAELNPDLQIRGTLNEPVITGRVSVVRGTLTYQKRTFDITRGVVDFSNPYRTQARVDMSAEGKIRDWTVTLEATGPLDNLNIGLSSVPAADNATILSLLATGKTPGELTGGGGGASASPANMLAEILADTYGEEVKRTTGLDILQLESGAQQAGSQDLKITVGEKLTRRLTVKYSVETSNSELTRTTTAEYKLLENILLNGFQDSKGTFGGDVQFRLEFR